jgi:hypothetical protein
MAVASRSKPAAVVSDRVSRGRGSRRVVPAGAPALTDRSVTTNVHNSQEPGIFPTPPRLAARPPVIHRT